MNEESKGLWHNIHAKRKRIAKGSGEKMRKPGSEGAPTKQDFERSAAKDKKESLMTFKEYINENYTFSYDNAILNWENTPIFLSPTMFKRVFDIPRKEGIHGLSIDNLINNIPQIIGKAKQISTFTYFDPENAAYLFMTPNQAITPSNALEAYILVEGRVSGQFNTDIYSSVLKGGRRFISLNYDTIEEYPFADILMDAATELRKFTLKTLNELGYHFKNPNHKPAFDDPESMITWPGGATTKMTGKEKNQLITKYMDFQEKLISSPKYKNAFFKFMVEMGHTSFFDYNEVTMDKIQVKKIYVTPEATDKSVIDTIKNIPAFKSVPIVANFNRQDLKGILDNLK